MAFEASFCTHFLHTLCMLFSVEPLPGEADPDVLHGGSRPVGQQAKSLSDLCPVPGGAPDDGTASNQKL